MTDDDHNHVMVPGSGYVTPEGHIEPTWLICVDCDYAEMAALAQKYADENKRLRTALYDTYGDLCQMVPGFRKPYIEAMLPEHFDGGEGVRSDDAAPE